MTLEVMSNLEFDLYEHCTFFYRFWDINEALHRQMDSERKQSTERTPFGE